ncbi:MAG: hypothetical protein WAL88_08360 [Nitrosotalea sp.]
MNLKLDTVLVDDWKINYLDFDKSTLILKKVVFGKIINSVTEQKEELLNWKRKIVESVFNEKIIVNPSSDSTYAISLSFRFHPQCHSSNKLDVENYVKPVIDGIAAGMFSKDPSTVTKFNFDDSNFKHILIEKLDTPVTPSNEGVAIVVVMAN